MSKRATTRKATTGHEHMLLEDLVRNLNEVCNPLAAEAARRLIAADATFKALAEMAGKEGK